IAVPTPLAFLATILWIAQPAYTDESTVGYPRPYHFALLVFLAGAIAIRRLKIDRPVPLVLAGAGFLLLAAAARNEYFLALMFFVGLVAVSSRFRSQPLLPTEHGTYPWPVCLLAGAGTLTTGIYLKGQVLRISRFWLAFAQHYSAYQFYKTTPGGKQNPMLDWELIAGRTFPGAHSMLGAALANPSAFLRFELHNITTAPRITCAYLIAPPYAHMKVLVLCLALVWLSFITLTSVSVRRHALFTSASALGAYVLSGAATAIPSTLVTPKIGYFLPLLFVVFVGAVKWLSVVFENEPAVYRSVGAVSAILLSLTFAAIRSPFDKSEGAEKPLLLEVSEVSAILEQQRVQGARILQVDGASYSAFVPYGLPEEVNAYEDRRDAEGFWDFVQRAHIDAILVDEQLRLSGRYRDDQDFSLLLASPDQFGWIGVPVGTRGDVFYLRDRRQNSLRR